MRSAHDRHRQALLGLGEGRHLDAVHRLAREGGVVPTAPPTVLRGALTPGPGPFARMVIALGPHPDQAVSVSCWPGRPDPGETVSELVERVERVGWVEVVPVVHDDPVAATAARLDGGDRAQVTLVRYHPGSRATVRVAHPGPEVRFAKVFSDERGESRYRMARRLAAAGLPLRVPRPLAYDADRCVLWHAALAGVPATALLPGPAGPVVARRLGVALGRLHVSGIRPTRGRAAEGLIRAERHARETGRLVPALGDRVLRLLDSVGPDAWAADSRVVPVHGSPYPTQWLLEEGHEPGLLDFDRFSWAEPEHDLASFLVELRALGPEADDPGVAEAFLDGHRSVFGPVDAAALQRHCTLRRVGKVLRAARALRADGDRRAERVLAAAERDAGIPHPGGQGRDGARALR